MVFGLQISNIHSIFFPENQLARIHHKAVLRSELTNFHWNQIKFCQLLQNLYVATKQSIKCDKKCARSWQSINFHCRNTKNLKPLKVAKWYVFLFFLWVNFCHSSFLSQEMEATSRTSTPHGLSRPLGQCLSTLRRRPGPKGKVIGTNPGDLGANCSFQGVRGGYIHYTVEYPLTH